VYLKKIRTDFINELGGRKGKDRTPLPLTSSKAERTISSFLIPLYRIAKLRPAWRQILF
jgi:hypothetical protein